jgi:hypothetical protein
MTKLDTALSYSEVVSLKSTMFNNRSRFLEKWRDTAQFLSPNRFNANPSDKHNGSKNDQKIFRISARLALRSFVSGMMNGATPQSRPWFRLTETDALKAQTKESRNYFSSCEKILSSYFQLSNLYKVLPLSYKDVGTFSNSAYAMLEHPEYGFYFYPFKMGTYGYSNNIEGKVDTFFREYALSIKQVVQMHGKLKPSGHIDWENSLNPGIKSMWEGARYEDLLLLSNVIMPNPNPKMAPLYSRDKRFQSFTYVDGAGPGIPNQTPMGFAVSKSSMNVNAPMSNGSFLAVKGYDYFPIVTPRWEVPPEEDYGVDGPGELALATVKGLQEKERYRQEAIAKLIKPPMVGPASLRRHQSSILAGGITYVDESVKGQFRAAFTIDPRISELVNSQQEDIAEIKSCFFEDLFMMLASEKPISHVTKAEIDERAAEKLQAIAPVLGQMEGDQNAILIETGFYLLYRQGKLPPVPKALLGRKIRPEYISPLAIASKAAMGSSVERSVGFVGSYANSVGDPSLVQIFNHEELLKRYCIEYAGMDPDLIRDPQEFAAIKQQIQQRQQQALQMQQAANEATVAKDLSQAQTGTGSLLDNVMGAEA